MRPPPTSSLTLLPLTNAFSTSSLTAVPRSVITCPLQILATSSPEMALISAMAAVEVKFFTISAPPQESERGKGGGLAVLSCPVLPVLSSPVTEQPLMRIWSLLHFWYAFLVVHSVFQSSVVLIW